MGIIAHTMVKGLLTALAQGGWKPIIARFPKGAGPYRRPITPPKANKPKKVTMASDSSLVGIIIGSQSDLDVMRNASETLDDLGIANEIKILSAHRNPEQVNEYAATARQRGLKVIIAGAGMAAALPGVVAAQTPLPVLGVPMETRVMGGMDSLLSMAQMPGGIPVGTLAIGKTGAKNAALLAAAILALSDEGVAGRLDAFRNKQNQAIAEVPAK